MFRLFHGELPRTDMVRSSKTTLRSKSREVPITTPELQSIASCQVFYNRPPKNVYINWALNSLYKKDGVALGRSKKAELLQLLIG